MVIDPSQWQTMQPFVPAVPGQSVGLGAGSAWQYASGGAARTLPNGQGAGQTAAGGAVGFPDTGPTATTNTSSGSGANPYDWTQAFIEQERSRRQEADRQYQIQLQNLDRQRGELAVSRNQQEANAWYNRELVKLSQAKLAEDKRQFDLSTAEAIRQFGIKQQELTRQFDITTAEGKRQFDLAQAENKRQFDATFGQRTREFEQDLSFRRDTLAEQMRQYDLTRQDGLDQFAARLGFDKDKLKEEARQFDLTTEIGRQQFAQRLAEDQRQFNVGATGYIDGQATLAREQWQNEALMGWVDRAIALASNPADWVKYKQMTMGVAGAAGEIPGLNWTQGGQQGNTAFAGTPQANSLQNVLGQMGTGTTPGAGANAVDLASLHPGIAHNLRQQQGGRQGYWTTEPGGQYTFHEAGAGQAGGPAAASGTDPSAHGYAEPMVHAGGTATFNEGGAPGVGSQQNPAGIGIGRTPAEQAAYDARVAAAGKTPDPAGGRGFVPPGGVAPAQQPGQPVTNWAQQAAGMIPTNTQLTANMSVGEKQLWDTADAFARNPQQQAPGWFEQQDAMTRELLKGAAQAQGHSWEQVMARMNRSKWGGGGSARAA